MSRTSKNDGRRRRYVDVWLKLKKKDGTLDRLYDHWIPGKEAEGTEPRWCIARDVLGWMD